MKKLFFLYVWLNLTRIAELRKEDLVKHMRKITIQTGRLFFSSSLNTFTLLYLNTSIHQHFNTLTFQHALTSTLKCSKIR